MYQFSQRASVKFQVLSGWAELLPHPSWRRTVGSLMQAKFKPVLQQGSATTAGSLDIGAPAIRPPSPAPALAQVPPPAAWLGGQGGTLFSPFTLFSDPCSSSDPPLIHGVSFHPSSDARVSLPTKPSSLLPFHIPLSCRGLLVSLSPSLTWHLSSLLVCERRWSIQHYLALFCTWGLRHVGRAGADHSRF